MREPKRVAKLVGSNPPLIEPSHTLHVVHVEVNLIRRMPGECPVVLVVGDGSGVAVVVVPKLDVGRF
jgi:hypothetical protein